MAYSCRLETLAVLAYRFVSASESFAVVEAIAVLVNIA